MLKPHYILVGERDTLVGSIIHDAYHAAQGWNNIGIEKEKRASAFSLGVAIKLRLDPTVIKWLESDAKHGHLPPTRKNRSPEKKKPK